MKEFLQANATHLPFADASVDLVLGSPPYADARSYGIGAQRKCQEWIDWMLTVTTEAVRVSRGLVLWVCASVTRDWCYWPGPEGLLYEWWKRGGRCWRPAYWHRVGIPGSGGKQWLRADIEYVLAFTSCKAAIPWADNTANGHPPKWAPGGEMSYRLSEGQRTNQWGKPIRVDGRPTGCNGDIEPGKPAAVQLRPSHRTKKISRRCTRGKSGGDTIQEAAYDPPVLANPGVLVELPLKAYESPNLIKGIRVGGGLMGHNLAHVNEAPYPSALAEWFIRGWCPLHGRVLDPFSGSGTTVAAAVALGRHGIGCDLRFNQCELGRKRCREVQRTMI